MFNQIHLAQVAFLKKSWLILGLQMQLATKIMDAYNSALLCLMQPYKYDNFTSSS